MGKIDIYNFENKRALIRVDFNVPINKETYEIKDDTRLRSSVNTIKKILNGGGSVVLMSHLGRPKQGPEKKYSLEHIVPHLSKLIGVEVVFVENCIGNKAFEITSSLAPGKVVLLENLRFHPQETAGTPSFAEQLSKHGDVYINDAFGTAHRAHASTTVVADYFEDENKMFGYLIEKEIESVNKIFGEGKSPIAAIVGGAKVSSKISVLKTLIEKIDVLFIGGGMSYTFTKAQGGEIGNSLVEDDYLSTALDILKEAEKRNVKVFLPQDSVIADQFSNDADIKTVDSHNIPNGYMGLDIGEKSIQKYCDEIVKCKTILWNGPVGVFEMSNFEKGSKAIAESIVKATQNGAFSLIGGGDSVSAINQFGLANQVSHVSTGGGAMLEYLEGRELPGIKAIKKGS